MANPLTALARLLVPPATEEDLRYRAVDEFPSMEQQLAAIRAQFTSPRPYRRAGIAEALGVPSILSAVSLIANTVGTLSLEAYRRGVLLKDEEVPRLIVRPNPYSVPRVFFRDTAYYLATRGEAWWWVAARDGDGVALSLYPVPPWEVRVEANERNRLFPRILWNDRPMPNEDMRHITYLPSPDGLRGVGPLQLADAAVSVTVEADAWAANFYSGALPSVVATTEQDLSPDEIDALAAQWLEKPNNVPRFLTNDLHLEEPPYDASKAQLTESRNFQVGEVARMFDMPGFLLEHQMGGSSLTYQNQESIWTDFQRRCLSPHYLEPIEQEISDLLTRSTVSRFNVAQLLRSDAKTRFEVYKNAVEVFGQQVTAEWAAEAEGLAPGSVEYAPVGPSSPQATPAVLPFQQRTGLMTVQCGKCHRVAGEFAGAFSTKCRKCGSQVVGTTEAQQPGRYRSEEPQTLVAAPTSVTVNPPPPANVTVNPPPAPPPANVTVNPTIEVPAVPVDVRLTTETPDSIARSEELLTRASDEVRDAVATLGAGNAQLVGALERTIAELSASAKRPRTLIPERDAEGRIVRVTQQ